MLAARASPYRWLGATAIHSQDKSMPSMLWSLSALCDHHPQLHIIVNFFDQTKVDTAGLVQRYSNSSDQIEGTNVPGMKTLFWQMYLTPERTQHLEFVWVFDCDIAVHPSTFPLGQVAGVLRATHATVIQPSIQALVHGTYHPWLRVKKAHMSCLATTAQWVEMQTPLVRATWPQTLIPRHLTDHYATRAREQFAGDAWAAFHRQVLSVIPEEGLSTSDFGLDIIWCAFLRDAFPTRPACLVTPSFAATHLNSHAIENFMSKEVIQKTRSCTTTCKTLYKNFKRYWKNFSHHTGECYSVSGHRGLLASSRHYAIDGDGMIRARFGHGGLTGGVYTEAPSSETGEAIMHTVRKMPHGVGAVSIGSNDKRLGLLTASLHKLLESVPGLRIVINMNDAEARKPSSGRKADISLDARISTTWINGPRSLFWKRVITPALLSEPVEYVWLFDATIAVHPSTNPLVQLVHLLKSTEASVAFPRIRSTTSAARSKAKESDASCAAVTMRTAAFAPSVIFKADAWKHFHGTVLTRLRDEHLAAVEPGFDQLVCGVVNERYERANRPACVEAFVTSTQLGDRRDLIAEAAAQQHDCPETTCSSPLRHMFPSTFNTSTHDDGKCWVASARGLQLSRGGRAGGAKPHRG